MAFSAGLVKGVTAFQVAASAVWLNTAAPSIIKESFPVISAGFSPQLQWNQKSFGGGRLSTDQAIELLGWLYEFRDSKAVSSFVRSNMELLAILVEAYGEIVRRFGFGTRLSLESVVDPDGSSSDDSLVVIVRVFISPERALALLDEFDMDWWLNVPPLARHKLTFVLEYA
jgi:hypothetical protein